MIDGVVIANNIINSCRMGHGIVLTTESTAALASYISHLREQNVSLQLARQAYHTLLNTHTPHVVGNINDYISEAEEALSRLRQYVKDKSA